MNFDEIEGLFGEERRNAGALIRPFNPSDSGVIKDGFYDGVLDHMELILDQNKSHLEQYVSLLKSQKERKQTLTFLCFDAQDSSFAGITQLKYIDLVNLKCEMGGTWYRKNLHGKGFNLACKQMIFQFVFEELKFRRLQFSIDVDNIVSVKSMKNIGATKEGTFRNNWVDSKGKSRDDFYFSVISEDWQKLKQTIYRDF